VPQVTEGMKRLAMEIGRDYGTPVMVIYGAVYEAMMDDNGYMKASRFLGYCGISSIFAVLLNSDSRYELCSVNVIIKPTKARVKVKDPGLVKIRGCIDI